MKTAKKFIFLFLLSLLTAAPAPAEKTAPAEFLKSDGVYPVVNAKPFVKFGKHIFFIRKTDEKLKQEIIVVGSPHIEIDKSKQELTAWKMDHSPYLNMLVSTGKAGIDEEGRESYETASGIFKVLETSPAVPWSKDEKVIMTDAIKIGENEKYIHSLKLRGEYRNYEKSLGAKASHGCIRLSVKNAFKLRRCIESCENWEGQTIIVYIFDDADDFLKRYPKTLKRIGKGDFYLVENASEREDILKNPAIAKVYQNKKNDYAVIKIK